MIETQEFQFYILTKPLTIGNASWSNGYLLFSKEHLAPSGYCLCATPEDLTGLCGEWVV